MLALDAGAPEIVQAMVAIGTKSSTVLRRSAIVRILPNERQEPSPMAAMSSQLWNEFEAFRHRPRSPVADGLWRVRLLRSRVARQDCTADGLGWRQKPDHAPGGPGDRRRHCFYFANTLIELWPASSGDLPQLVLSGPVDTEVFRPSEHPPNEPAAICVGRIMPHKGIDRIIRALPAGLKLRVVGRVYHEEYRALLGSLAVGKDVEFVHDASDEELVSLYQQSTVFVQGSCIRDIYGSIVSKTELMGLTTLEAMACGLPVIVSADGGSLPELVTDTRFGYVFSDEHDLSLRLRLHQAGAWPGIGRAGECAGSRDVNLRPGGVRAATGRLLRRGAQPAAPGSPTACES